MEAHTEEVTSVAFSPNSKYIATGSNDSTAIIWDLNLKSGIRKLDSHDNKVNHLAISHDCKYISIMSEDKIITIWNFKSGTIYK